MRGERADLETAAQLEVTLLVDSTLVARPQPARALATLEIELRMERVDVGILREACTTRRIDSAKTVHVPRPILATY